MQFKMVKSLDGIVEKLHNVDWKKAAKYSAFAAVGAAAGGLGVWGGLNYLGNEHPRLFESIFGGLNDLRNEYLRSENEYLRLFGSIFNHLIFLGLTFVSGAAIGAKLGIVGAKVHDKNYKGILDELKLLPYEVPFVLAGGYAGAKIGEKISQDVFPAPPSWIGQSVQDVEYAIYGSLALGALSALGVRYLAHKFDKTKKGVNIMF